MTLRQHDPVRAALEGSGGGSDKSTISFEGAWRASIEDIPGAQAPDFNDAGWASLHVPHFAKELYPHLPRPRTKAWLRKSIELPKVEKGHRALLEIRDAQRMEAWVNGQSAGPAPDWAIEHFADVTDSIQAGRNSIAVQVSMDGVQGGVFLHLVPDFHIEPGSLIVDTPEWAGGPVRARLRCFVRNFSSVEQEGRLEAAVHGPDGRELAVARSGALRLAPGRASLVELVTDPIADPPLWQLWKGGVCRATASLIVAGKALHSQEAEFGFRWVRFTIDDGFFLNGEKVQMRGVVYSFSGPGDFPTRDDLWKYEVNLFREMGINLIRTTSAVDNTIFRHLDRGGIMATPALHERGDGGDTAAVARQEWRQRGNNASNVLWHYNGEGKNATRSRVLNTIWTALKACDPARPLMCVEYAGRSPGNCGILDCDVPGYANFTGWYEGTLDQVGLTVDEFRDFYKERWGFLKPMIYSSYGCAADYRVHTDHPRRNDFSEEYKTLYHKKYVREIGRRPWLAGSLIFAFRDVHSGQAIPRHTWKGVVDIQENKRDAFYFYKSVWTTEPMVRIAQQSWTPRDVWPPNSTRPIEVFSNCDEVELFHKGKSLGRKAGGDFVWDVTLAEGSNELKAEGRKGDAHVSDKATIEAQFRPPAPEPSIAYEPASATTGSHGLSWPAIPGAVEYELYTGPTADFAPDSGSFLGKTDKTRFAISRPGRGAFYKVVAGSAERSGPASLAVGVSPGALLWRYPNPAWLASSPALADLNGDGLLEIVITSTSGKAFALDHRGECQWEFDTKGIIFASPAVAPLRAGEKPAIAFQSCHALYLLDAEGRLFWKRDGLRQFDRSNRSPAMADLNGDGRLEILSGSDTGLLVVFDAEGKELWRFSTAGEGNRGLCQTTPVVVDAPEWGGKAVVFSADDGFTYLLNAKGELCWKHDHGLGEDAVGPAPAGMTPCAGALTKGGEPRILVSARGLKAFDLQGRLVWERSDIGGTPQIAELFNDGEKQILLGAGKNVRVLNSQGGPVWSFVHPDPRDFFINAPVAASLDDSGEPGLLAGTRGTVLYAFGSHGKILWTVPTEDELSSQATAADINGDGAMEVVFASRDGFIRCVAAGRAPKRARNALQFLGGPARTGEHIS